MVEGAVGKSFIVLRCVALGTHPLSATSPRFLLCNTGRLRSAWPLSPNLSTQPPACRVHTLHNETPSAWFLLPLELTWRHVNSIPLFCFSLLMRRFRRRMYSMVRKFMRSARQRLDLHAVKVVERHAPFANRIRLLHRLYHIRFRECNRFNQ